MEHTEQARLTVADVRGLATISVEQAAALLGIGRAGGYKAASTGELPTIRLGRRLVVPVARLLAMLDVPQQASAGRPDPLRV